MGERKVLNRYVPPDFDPSIIPKMKRDKNKLIEVRMMLPFSMRCNTCSNYMYRGKKFNSKSEIAHGEEYMGIRRFRFYIKCSVCNAEITFKTDPKNTDYECESGASRNFEVWRDQEAEKAEAVKDREAEEEVDAMKALENRTMDSKIEMDVLDALDEIKAINQRHVKVDTTQILNSLHAKRASGAPDDVVGPDGLTAKDRELIKSIKFKNGSSSSSSSSASSSLASSSSYSSSSGAASALLSSAEIAGSSRNTLLPSLSSTPKNQLLKVPSSAVAAVTALTAPARAGDGAVAGSSAQANNRSSSSSSITIIRKKRKLPTDPSSVSSSSSSLSSGSKLHRINAPTANDASSNSGQQNANESAEKNDVSASVLVSTEHQQQPQPAIKAPAAAESSTTVESSIEAAAAQAPAGPVKSGGGRGALSSMFMDYGSDESE